MSVGVHEILFLSLVTLFAFGALLVARHQLKWIMGIPICVAIAVCVTPSDLGSTFIVAAPYTVGYTYLILARKHDQGHVKKSQ